MKNMTSESSSLMRSAAAKKLPRRYAAEKRFRFYGKLAIFFALAFLLTLLYGTIMRGLPAFQKTQVGLDILFDPAFISEGSHCSLPSLVNESLLKLFPDTPKESLNNFRPLISPGSCRILLERIQNHPEDKDRTLRIWLPLSDDADLFLKNRESQKSLHKYRRLNAEQMQALDKIEQKGRLKTIFNWRFFTRGDARNPEFAGIASAFAGSFYVIIIALLFAFPMGIAAALYLEEFNKRSYLSQWIEVNISNLAAVPSIVFGLLGLALFLGFFGLPRSSALAGGLTLGLMTLPTIIITSRSALAAVPKSIRYAAQGMGASDVQVVLHHVLPLAMPGILTGSIIGTARALGETAPLLMIGMMAFIGDIPHSPLDPTSALPTQIFMWARNPEPGFIANAAAGIIVLLAFIIFMNMIAIILRRKFEQRW